MAGRRLAAWDDFRLVVIRPVVEAGSKPGAACFAASRLGVVVHGGRPQVGVLQVVRRPVGEKLAIRPRRPGRAGWRRGTISASSSSGQSSKLAPSPEPPASPPPASVLSSMAAAPKSGSSKSCAARSGRNWRSAPADPAVGRRRGFCQDEPTGQSPPSKTW